MDRRDVAEHAEGRGCHLRGDGPPEWLRVMSTRRSRFRHALAGILPLCSPLCRVVEGEDTNHSKTEHALGCPVWHQICRLRADEEKTR